jgi:hypothetical protein
MSPTSPARGSSSTRPGSTRNSPPTTPTPWPRSCRWPATGPTGFEFQRLHGMGEALHEMVRRTTAPPAASMRRWGGIATSWPTSCGGFWKTGRTPPSSTGCSTPLSRRRRWPADPFSTPRASERRIRGRRDRRTCSARAANSRGIDLHDRTVARRWNDERATPSPRPSGRLARSLPWPGGGDGGAGHETPRARMTSSGGHALPRRGCGAPPRPLALGRGGAGAPMPCAAPPTSTRPTRRRFRPSRAGGGQDPARCRPELREAVDFLRYYGAQAATLDRSAPRASSPASAPGTSRSPSSRGSSRRHSPPATRFWQSPPRRRRSLRHGPSHSFTRPACRAGRSNSSRAPGPRSARR